MTTREKAASGQLTPGPRASLLNTQFDESAAEADVIVVGAGPAGSTAAITLAKRGIDVILLEKSSFPREKVCGDGLTPRTVKVMNRLGIDTGENSGWKRNYGLRVYDGNQSFEFPWPQLKEFPDYGLTCRREVFDDLLAGLAAQNGARCYTNQNVSEPIRNRDGRIVGVRTAEGREFRAPFAIAADGNASRLALRMGIPNNPKRPMAVAVRSYFTSPRSDIDYIESWLSLGDGFRISVRNDGGGAVRNDGGSGSSVRNSKTLPGYGWIFPLGDGTVNVGVGMLSTAKEFRSTDYRALLKKWVATLPAEWELTEANMTAPIRGAQLPMAFRRMASYHQGLLVTGDAAGLVSPMDGEGISYAMESGELAADAVTEALARGVGSPNAERALLGYAASLQGRFGDYYQFGTIFASLIGNPFFMRICVDYGLPRKRLMRLVQKLLSNLSDSRDGDVDDRLFAAIVRTAAFAGRVF